jgi:hypothetical protein
MKKVKISLSSPRRIVGLIFAIAACFLWMQDISSLIQTGERYSVWKIFATFLMPPIYIFFILRLTDALQVEP